MVMLGTSEGLWDWNLVTDQVYFSPRWRAMLGYEDEEIPNHFDEWQGRIHPDDVGRALEVVKTFMASSNVTYELDHRVRHKDGTYRWIRTRAAAARDADGKAVRIAGSNSDITRRVESYRGLEQMVQERTRELSTLLEISKNVASTLELSPLLGLILDQLKAVVDYTGAALFTIEGDRVRTVEYRGPIPQEQVVGYSHSLSGALADQEVIRRRAPLIIGDVWGDEPLAHGFQRTAGERMEENYNYIRSWMAVPLILQDRVIGLLTLDHTDVDHYQPAHAQLALAIASHAAVAMENARLYAEARDRAALEQRQHLARELHDSVSQALYGIALGARTARTLLDRDPAQAIAPVEYVLSLAETGLMEMRALIFELRPESLETEGIVVAFTKQADSLRARHGMNVRLELCDEPDLPVEAKEALYRIGQEAMHNTVKHARATTIELSLQATSDGIVLVVRDDGAGFDTGGSFPGHLGLRSMRERATRLGGDVKMESKPGHGTVVRARIPAQTSPYELRVMRDEG